MVLIQFWYNVSYWCFFLWRTSYWSNIQKKLKEIPSRHVLGPMKIVTTALKCKPIPFFCENLQHLGPEFGKVHRKANFLRWFFYPSPKTFYTRLARDKFHFWDVLFEANKKRNSNCKKSTKYFIINASKRSFDSVQWDTEWTILFL